MKIILGGASNSKDLHDLTTLIGGRDEVIHSTTIGDYRLPHRATLHPPSTDHAADMIRTLPFGTGLVILRSAPPIVTRMRT